MIPYGSFTFFGILIVLLIPAVVLGFLGKRLTTYTTFLSFVFLLLIFSSSKIQTYYLVAFIIWVVILIKGYSVYRKNANHSTVYYLSVFLSILPLIIVKVSPIFESTTLVGFLGISYLTFKATQVIIEIRDHSIKEISIVDFLKFLLFFPTISSGPIDRFRRFQQDSQKKLTASEYQEYFQIGVHKIFIGFLYKYIIGYLINVHILETQLVVGHTFVSNLTYMYAYSLYLFFDFAGYSAFAIGVSYLVGIKTPENFNMPFISRNIKDFWNRWHMSLSFWFRDYVYMRMVFLLTKKKVIKNRRNISYISYTTLFLLMGAWHGIQINYLLYGLYQALLMCSFDWFEQFNKKKKIWKNNKLTHVLAVIITFHFICFGFLIFSGHLVN
ncbi:MULTISPECIES: D-alanyl-lipoteichoic acid biosynthesis protein DltB [unclassified Bacillus (in: firmicutes)]|uniref:D-alanyl-lipoteichoic acid biosynthesis protein DltB n=1 Tax=unclassified Bacillus (in: firmicutes) TaxID=185979 RepID=UPI0008E9BD58|nr:MULTISPECIES: D-alanyl-lipoteichoic acid biosynthesis protein DltB [unclassified Bacillus (in: firmicutes)]PGZ93243.1 D-alanyl-lipoteichoic acid biosynthesis protein DltB [Bacillus sp. AFS029533]SFD23194.1 membrane protein involved in D-alanine export [Bacillus sp. UNCCL81]